MASKRKAPTSASRKPPAAKKLERKPSLGLSEAKKFLEQAKDEVQTESDKLQQQLKEAEAKEILPGLTLGQFRSEMNIVPVHTPGEGLGHWKALCNSKGGPELLFHLYRSLYETAQDLAMIVADHADSAALSLESLETFEPLGESVMHNHEFECAQASVTDIENQVASMDEDLRMAQVLP